MNETSPERLYRLPNGERLYRLPNGQWSELSQIYSVDAAGEVPASQVQPTRIAPRMLIHYRDSRIHVVEYASFEEACRARDELAKAVNNSRRKQESP